MTIWFNPEELGNLNSMLATANSRVEQANFELMSALEARKRIQYLIAIRELDKKGIHHGYIIRGHFIDIVVSFEEGSMKCRLEGIELYHNDPQLLIRGYTKKGKPMAKIDSYDLDIVKYIEKFTESK